ncbi:MAG: glycerol-3-phosphate acyltransferase [Halanaerobiales bacterium]
MEILLVVISYLIGSLSLAQRLAKRKNIKINSIGTKNPGAFNVYNEVSHFWGYVSGAFDIFKGVFPVFIGKIILNIEFPYLVLITVAAVLGHMWPIYFKFEGGRGLATSLGTLLVLDFYLVLFVLVISASIIFWIRYLSKLEPRVSLLMLPLFILASYYFRGNMELVSIGIYLTIVIYIKAAEFRYSID